MKIEITSMVTAKWIDEMVPYFFQFSQNLTSDCLLISVFLHDVIIKLFCKTNQFYDHIIQKLVKTDKNRDQQTIRYQVLAQLN